MTAIHVQDKFKTFQNKPHWNKTQVSSVLQQMKSLVSKQTQCRIGEEVKPKKFAIRQVDKGQIFYCKKIAKLAFWAIQWLASW